MTTLNRIVRTLFAVGLLSCLDLGVVFAEDPFQILFFGNSHTVTQSSNAPKIPDIISDIAVAAGRSAPITRNLASNGKSLQWHLNNNTQGIVSPAPPADWDFVVLQDRAAGPTRVEGNLAQHISSSLSLYQNVAAHSPDVVPVMYETWARGAGSSYYTAPDNFFTDPSEMQEEVRSALHMSTDNINNTVGHEVARFAPVGDAWEEADFEIGLYRSNPLDYNHASNSGKFLTSLVLYGTIYEDSTVSDIDLSDIISELGVSARRVPLIIQSADAVLAVPEPTSLGLMMFAMLSFSVFSRRMIRS